MAPALPERLRLQFLGLIGEEAGPWLVGLPGLVGRLCREWDVELEGTFEDGWSSYVAFGTRRGEPVVLKVAPKLADGRAEIAGLRARDGAGVPPLLRCDVDAAALLLPRVQPGIPLVNGEAGDVAALLRRLHIPVQTPPRHVPRLAERLAAHWSGRSDPVGRLAAARAQELCASWTHDVFLHGDFEARNILRAGDGLVAIDSPAAIGDPGYDAASWVLSEHEGDAEALRHLAAALDYPAERIRHWTWSLAVDSLLDKLHQPGWPQASIERALEVARRCDDWTGS